MFRRDPNNHVWIEKLADAVDGAAHDAGEAVRIGAPQSVEVNPGVREVGHACASAIQTELREW